jgi:WD40 repeat protein
MRSSWDRVATGVLAALLVFLAAGLGNRPATAQDAPAGLVEKKVKSLGKVLSDVRKPLLLSPDGDRVAYLAGAWKIPKVRMVCDGKESLPYATLISFCFSPDGKCFGFMGTHMGQRPGAGGVFLRDGVEKPVSHAGAFAFSPDSKHVAYCGPGDVLMLDGTMVKTGGFCRDPVFSPDGRHLACRVQWENKCYVICDAGQDRSFDDVRDIVFCPTSEGLAYACAEGDAWFVVWGAAKLGPYKEVGRPVFSPDGNCLAFKAHVAKSFVVHKSTKGPEFDDVGDPVFSLQGAHLAYTTMEGKDSCILCDGKKEPACTAVGTPVFSPDGNHLAYYATREGKTFAVCDGKESENFLAVTWIGFSPDNKHLVFTGGNDGKRSIVCDGLAGPVHDDVLLPEHFYDAPGKLRYVAVDKMATGDDKQASLVEVNWPTDRTWEDTFMTKTP